MEHVAAIPAGIRNPSRSSILHRTVNGFNRIFASLGRVLFGIGDEPRRAPRRWWEEADESLPAPEPAPSARRSISLPKAGAPRQLSLRGFDLSADSPASPAAPRAIAPAAVPAAVAEPESAPAPAAEPAARRLPGAVGFSTRSGTLTALVDLVSRPSAPAVPVTRPLAIREAERAAAIASAVPQRGAVARQLILSQSLYRGSVSDVAKHPSVPRRAILPRFQLFEGEAGVVQDKDGGFLIPARGKKARGNVFFV
jgi:hypothetical protein